jgi:hypothetical protein
MIGVHGRPGQVAPKGLRATGREALTMRTKRHLPSRFRYLLWSPWAPYRLASALMDLGALALAAVGVWLVFGGPVSHLYFVLVHAAAVAAGTAH